MKYRTKVRELEAIRFNGTNRDEINKLTGLQFEVMETMRDVKYLRCGGGLVYLGDWEEGCDEYIGKALTVVGFDDVDNDIKVRVEKGTIMYVPYTVLEKVECDIYLELSKALDSVGILTTSARAEGNRITIKGVIR